MTGYKYLISSLHTSSASSAIVRHTDYIVPTSHSIA